MTSPTPTPDPRPAAASTLLTPLLDGPSRPLVEAARTRLSVHYTTDDERVPVLCVVHPDAVRLPHAVVSSTLPGPGALLVGAGMLGSAAATWRVTRWWRPPCPAGLAPPPDPGRTLEALAGVRAPGGPVLHPADGLVPARLVGQGPGLTPSGDDLLAAALVTAHATSDPRLPHWRAGTRAALAVRSTTAVSRGILHAALDGWATPELDAFLRAVCTEVPEPGLAAATRRLLAVGHSSGAALAAGVHFTLTTRDLRGAA